MQTCLAEIEILFLRNIHISAALDHEIYLRDKLYSTRLIFNTFYKYWPNKTEKNVFSNHTIIFCSKKKKLQVIHV